MKKVIIASAIAAMAVAGSANAATASTTASVALNLNAPTCSVNTISGIEKNASIESATAAYFRDAAPAANAMAFTVNISHAGFSGYTITSALSKDFTPNTGGVKGTATINDYTGTLTQFVRTAVGDAAAAQATAASADITQTLAGADTTNSVTAAQVSGLTSGTNSSALVYLKTYGIDTINGVTLADVFTSGTGRVLDASWTVTCDTAARSVAAQ